MIKPEELRINNIVKNPSPLSIPREGISSSDWMQVTAYGIYQASEGILEFEGVELSEEWLLRMGFKYQRPGAGGQDSWAGYGYWQLPNSEFNLIGTKNGTVYFQRCWDWQIKTVNQLQNLYYSLTGAELTIKDLQPESK